ncbi:hypothetical protein GGX14DRAFT_392910 [Mycena pura]|uniref:Uncharacterized protein n=1 Tax=Mycena pura TaxID=153505 RepID=A0AAD6VJG8_9AGAR|nr:hypothetical protein GGX14DRAFT_392910 [Mycena pura]
MPNTSHRYNPPKIAEVVGDDEQSGAGKVGTSPPYGFWQTYSHSLDVEDDDELHPAGDIHHSTWLSPLIKISPGSSSGPPNRQRFQSGRHVRQDDIYSLLGGVQGLQCDGARVFAPTWAKVRVAAPGATVEADTELVDGREIEVLEV